MIPQNSKGQFIKGGGYKLTEEHKRKIAQSHIGIGKGVSLSENHRMAIAEGMKKATNGMNDKKNCSDSYYQSVHKWMQRWYGKPKKCDFCQRTNPPKGKGKNSDYFHWANKNGKYLRERRDWYRLCAICHRNYDFNKQGNS